MSFLVMRAISSKTMRIPINTGEAVPKGPISKNNRRNQLKNEGFFSCFLTFGTASLGIKKIFTPKRLVSPKEARIFLRKIFRLIRFQSRNLSRKPLYSLRKRSDSNILDRQYATDFYTTFYPCGSVLPSSETTENQG